MGWEKGKYYTRSRREGGMVVRQYIGGGELGRLVAEGDRRQRQQDAAARRAWQREQERVRQAERTLIEWDTLCVLVMRAALEDAGYHQHDRGEWRKRRGEKC